MLKGVRNRVCGLDTTTVTERVWVAIVSSAFRTRFESALKTITGRKSYMKRILLTFGFAWCVVWLIAGMLLSLGYDAHIAEVRRLISANNPLSAWDVWVVWKSSAVNHAHGLLFAFIAVLAGLVMPEIGFSDRIKAVLGWTLIAGIVIYTVAGVFHIALVMGAGGLITLAALTGVTVGLARGRSD